MTILKFKYRNSIRKSNTKHIQTNIFKVILVEFSQQKETRQSLTHVKIIEETSCAKSTSELTLQIKDFLILKIVTK